MKKTVSSPRESTSETALLSEAALADWNREEEDEAWQHLQQEPVSIPTTVERERR